MLIHTSLSQTCRILLVLMALTIWYSSIGVTRAAAGTYKIYSCNVPGRPTTVPSAAPWRADLDGLNTGVFDDCAVGGNFGIRFNPDRQLMHRVTTASLTLERPSTGPKSAIGIVQYRTWISAELAGSGAPAFITDGGAFGPPGGTTPESAPWISSLHPQNNPSVHIVLYCSGGAPTDCQFDSAVPLRVRGVEADLYEDVPPSGEIEGGSLLEAGAENGRTLSYSATDQESGIARVEVLLSDTVVAVDDLDSSKTLCSHTEFNACPSRHAADLTIDSSRVTPGKYTVTLRITDAAGNRQLVTDSRPVSIGEPLSVPAVRLTASFANSRSTYTTSFGRSARVRGRLTDASGHGIAGARIDIVERPATPFRRERRSRAVTDTDGTFSYVARGNGTSRAIEFRLGDEGAMVRASLKLRLRVRAASTFTVLLRGDVVHYSGLVLTRPIPKEGKQIFMQGRRAGGAWQRFAVRRTDKAGRFSGRYRLRVRRPGVRLQFRVEIPKQTGYPFVRRFGNVISRVVH